MLTSHVNKKLLQCHKTVKLYVNHDFVFSAMKKRDTIVKSATKITWHNPVFCHKKRDTNDKCGSKIVTQTCKWLQN